MSSSRDNTSSLCKSKVDGQVVGARPICTCVITKKKENVFKGEFKNTSDIM